MRKIPTSMATQHPDNAGKPFWYGKAFVSSEAEIKESYACFSRLSIDEYNWDWEGKFVDEAVVDRLLHEYHSYFAKHPLGKEKFLTFRIPNPRVEKQFRLARAFMVIITSSQLAKTLGFRDHPIFESILPLTETAEEILDIQEAFRELVSLEHRLLKMEESIKHIEIIPLFEQVRKLLDSERLLLRYIRLHKQKFGKVPTYLRPYCARSDPALNSGLVPTMLALKAALSSYRKVEHLTGVRLFPMLGTGTLPFRGGLSPYTIDKAIDEYAGVRTFTVQSAFRYDFPQTAVKEAILKLKERLPLSHAYQVTPQQVRLVNNSINFFEKPYQETVESMGTLINTLSSMVAKRRERVQHIGLFGYSRGVGRVTLPRAIPFTASLYSVGIPPELIGTGRGINAAKKKGYWKEIMPLYRHLKDDLIEAGYYLNRQNLSHIAKASHGCYEITNDIRAIEQELGITLGPKDPEHFEHKNLTDRVYNRIIDGKDATQLITYTGILRRSLG